MPYESDPVTSKLNGLVGSQELYWDLPAFNKINPAEQALIGTWELANEVYNGGFMQYFRNSSHAKRMVEVLRLIDAHQAADILASAIVLIGPGTPWGDEPNFSAAVKLIPEDTRRQLRQLERNFYEGLDEVHLRLFRYLSKHRDQIDAPADFWTEATIQ